MHLPDRGREKIAPEELERRGLRAPKTSYGPQPGAAVRLPGKLPALLAEGVETGLAAHAATGHAVLIALGGLGKLDAPAFAVALADDGPPPQPADRALTRALSAWRADGRDVLVARPWPVRRFDKSDFADVILQDGPAAVRARIELALDAGTSAVRRVPSRLPASAWNGRCRRFPSVPPPRPSRSPKPCGSAPALGKAGRPVAKRLAWCGRCGRRATPARSSSAFHVTMLRTHI